MLVDLSEPAELGGPSQPSTSSAASAASAGTGGSAPCWASVPSAVPCRSGPWCCWSRGRPGEAPSWGPLES